MPFRGSIWWLNVSVYIPFFEHIRGSIVCKWINRYVQLFRERVAKLGSLPRCMIHMIHKIKNLVELRLQAKLWNKHFLPVLI